MATGFIRNIYKKWSPTNKIFFWIAILGIAIGIAPFFTNKPSTIDQSGAIGSIATIGQVGNNTVLHQEITKVEKELANTEESLEARYSALKNITLGKPDIGQKITSVQNQDHSKSTLVIALDDIPINNSVRISTDRGDISPDKFDQFSNILLIHTECMDAKWFFTYYTKSCHIQYAPKSTGSGLIIHFDEIQMSYTTNNTLLIKPLTKELEEFMKTNFSNGNR